MNIYDDVNRWGRLLCPPPGSTIHRACYLAVEARRADALVEGLVFNGVVLHIRTGDVAASLVGRYLDLCGGKK